MSTLGDTVTLYVLTRTSWKYRVYTSPRSVRRVNWSSFVFPLPYHSHLTLCPFYGWGSLLRRSLDSISYFVRNSGLCQTLWQPLLEPVTHRNETVWCMFRTPISLLDRSLSIYSSRSVWSVSNLIWRSLFFLNFKDRTFSNVRSLYLSVFRLYLFIFIWFLIRFTILLFCIHQGILKDIITFTRYRHERLDHRLSTFSDNSWILHRITLSY